MTALLEYNIIDDVLLLYTSIGICGPSPRCNGKLLTWNISAIHVCSIHGNVTFIVHECYAILLSICMQVS